MGKYAKALQKHLVDYKARRLGVREAGIFKHKGRDVSCAHILPLDLKWLNILEPFRSEIHAYLKTRPEVKLHKYFHHLNSSQAFALNLFYPFLEGEPAQASALLRALGVKGEIESWSAECVPHLEEGTNVDIAWKDCQGAWTYCEVKLSEQEFGQAKADTRHREKLTTIYDPVLRCSCPETLLEPLEFFDNYQIMRNIWLAARDPTASVTFLLPRANRGPWIPLQKVIGSLALPLRKRVRVAAIEDVLSCLVNGTDVSPRLAWYTEMLIEKYVLPKST